MDRTEKRAFVQALQAVFADTSFVLVSQNKGLTVADATTLRQRTSDNVIAEIAATTGTNWYASPSGRAKANPAANTAASMR